jgi:hypothetical protein
VAIVMCHFLILRRRNHSHQNIENQNPDNQTEHEPLNIPQEYFIPSNPYRNLEVSLGSPDTPERPERNPTSPSSPTAGASGFGSSGERQPLLSSFQGSNFNRYTTEPAPPRATSSLPRMHFWEQSSLNPFNFFRRKVPTSPPPSRRLSFQDLPMLSNPLSSSATNLAEMAETQV